MDLMLGAVNSMVYRAASMSFFQLFNLYFWLWMFIFHNLSQFSTSVKKILCSLTIFSFGFIGSNVGKW
jgi:hypothetical protein